MLYSKFAFPVFTWITILVILIPVVFILIYRHFYKKHLDKVINDSRYHKKMASPFEVVIVSIIVVLFVGIFVSFFSGYKLAQNYYEDMIDHFSATDIETYYAEIKMINENIIFVDGISMNEEKYQGEFKYEVSDEVSIVKDDKIITVDQLKEGDLVSIVLVTGEGNIQGITDVFKITVIDEEN